MLHAVRTRDPLTRWPPLPDAVASRLLSLQMQLEWSQWWSTAALAARQLTQLEALVDHARRAVPHYRARLEGLRGAALTEEAWRTVPVLRRADLERDRERLLASGVPASHGASGTRQTSGTTGAPLVICSTERAHELWLAVTLRDHLWHRRDPDRPAVVVRSGRSAEDAERIIDRPSWGPPLSLLRPTGPSTRMYHRLPLPRLVDAIRQRAPAYLLAYPSAALQIALRLDEHREALPSLRQLRTYGEPLPPAVQHVLTSRLRVPVCDVYSCEEAGYLALQCPEQGSYHVPSEHVRVEVLRDDGEPCAPGEIGRVVVTNLHNFAMPLLRYEVGDHAEVGAPCPCGRGLPVLARVLGRARHRFVRADGTPFWPSLPATLWDDVPGLGTLQLLQRRLGQVEARYVTGAAWSSASAERLADRLQGSLGEGVALRLVAVPEVQRHPNGKLELFVGEAHGA